LEKVAEVIRGVHTIRLTGGEPSIHPMFAEIATAARELFRCKVLEVETNGASFPTNQDIFTVFDLVEVTNYTEPNFVPNKDLVDLVLKNPKLKGIIHIGSPVVHFPRSRRAPGTCERGNLTMVSIYKNRIYPCAMGWGIDNPVSVPLSSKWIEELKKLKLPCERCFMAGT
jgi:hypothetical protein